MVRLAALVLAVVIGWPAAALAQQNLSSQCLAVARSIEDVPVRYASFAQPAQSGDEAYTVSFSFQGHSTYLIETPDGTTIATDYAGWMTDPVVPLVVTMNQAHSSHWTTNTKPGTEYVLPGWTQDGSPAEHSLMVGDALIRNVTTDIVRFASIPDGNSIFIFEVAGLCIGHLGHLHHALTDDHYAKIGRLDVVMVPVDGGLTLAHTQVRDLLARMRSRVILPMHVRSAGALPSFLSYLGEAYPVQQVRERKLRLSMRNLPDQPTVMLLPGVSYYFSNP